MLDVGLEDWGEFALLGQDELGTSVFENAFKDQIKRAVVGNDLPELDTERIILAAARVGQHVFALNVLNNCGRRCFFCGLNPSAFSARRMLLAGHIKPWKDSTPAERLDPQNGLAACPSHDVALHTALLTVSAELKTHIAPSLADAVRGDDLTRQYYGRPPLLEIGIARKSSSLDRRRPPGAPDDPRPREPVDALACPARGPFDDKWQVRRARTVVRVTVPREARALSL